MGSKHWDILLILFILLAIGLSIAAYFSNIPLKGIQSLLSNYLLISTAILAIVSASVTLEKKIIEINKSLIEVSLLFSLLGVISSFLGLFCSYLSSTFYVFLPNLDAAQIFFYFATFFVLISIFSMILMADAVIVPDKKTTTNVINSDISPDSGGTSLKGEKENKEKVIMNYENRALLYLTQVIASAAMVSLVILILGLPDLFRIEIGLVFLVAFILAITTFHYEAFGVLPGQRPKM